MGMIGEHPNGNVGVSVYSQNLWLVIWTWESFVKTIGICRKIKPSSEKVRVEREERMAPNWSSFPSSRPQLSVYKCVHQFLTPQSTDLFT